MIRQQTKSNKNGFTPTPNFKKKSNLVSGFTLIETMVAVFILSISIVSLMNVVASSLFAARYARDEITANYLLQEVVDYIRNDRDSLMLSENTSEKLWESFWGKYKICDISNSNGCYIDVLSSTEPQPCYSSDCGDLYYDDNSSTSFYTHDENKPGVIKSKFNREILIENNNSNNDEFDVTVTVSWKNGGLNKSRTLKTSLLNWRY